MHTGVTPRLDEVRFEAVWPYIAATPLYRDKLQSSGIDIHSVRNLSDLRRLPFTQKNDLRATSVFERTPQRIDEIYAIYSSGGTSGEATLYAWNAEDIQIQKEISRRVFEGIGVSSQDLALVLAPLSLPVMGHCMIWQYEAVGASFIPLGPANPDSVLAYLRQLPVTLIATLPVVASRLYQYLRFVQNAALDPHLQVRQFHLGGDALSTARRKRLEENWKAQCYDLYGISEIFGPLCGECHLQNGLHFPEDYVYLEILDPVTHEPVPDGERGIAVYTTLWRKGSPLLRYWSDDYVARDTKPCACGRASPRIIYLGRKLDCMLGPTKLLFPKDIEDVILRFPVSDEYFLEYTQSTSRGYVVAKMEPLPDFDFPTRELSDALGDVLKLDVELEVCKPGSLARDTIKPKRFVNFPAPGGNRNNI